MPRDKAEESKAFTNSIGEASPSKEAQSSSPPPRHPENEKLASSNATSGSRTETLRNSYSKLSTLRQQLKERKGVPEPRDPVTGRGLHTGLTPEELNKHVESTRGPRAFVTGGISEMGANTMATEPAREGMVRPEELEALKNWQSQKQAGDLV